MLRKLLISFITILLLIAVALGLFLSGGPDFPAKSDEIIADVIHKGPPVLVKGKTGYAQSAGVRIWYETREPTTLDVSTPKGTILLIMGAGASSMMWTPDWLDELTGQGYRVIRYDHRGTGMSDWQEDWAKDEPYTIEDMADDAIAVLDANDISQAHVVGVSMGGMIAQRLAISHKNRVATLTSVSTSADIFDPELAGLANNYFAVDMLRLTLKYGLGGSESGMTKLWMGIIELMRSDRLNAQDVQEIANMVLYEMRQRQGYNRQVMEQHMAAMKASGSRLSEMKNIQCPVLVIHGTADELLNIAHAKKYALLIPNAKNLWLEGEGHVFRESAMTQVNQALFRLIGNSNQSR